MKPSDARRSRLVGVLFPLAAVAAAGLAVWIVRREPEGLLGWATGGALGALFLWILASALWPARAERTCPRCGAAGLARLDPRAAHGVGCERCGFRDESASAWLLAEEEGPLEELVLRARGRHGASARTAQQPRVDSTASRD